MIVGVLAASLAWLCSWGRDSFYNNYTLLAQAFLAGHVWIDVPPPTIDALPFEDKYYVIEGPVPALLMMPWLAAVGRINQTLFACILAGVAMAAAWELTRRLGVVRRVDRALLMLFAFLGTGVAWCAMLGDVWMLAHVSSFAFTLLALVELFANRPRAWLVMFFAVLAAGSRFVTVLAIPIYLWWLWRARAPDFSVRRFVAGAAAVLVPAVALFVAYNEVRWHGPLDQGYTLWYRTSDPIGEPDGSPFSFAFVPYELLSFFVNGFRVAPAWPYLFADVNGQSLTVAAPAYAIALFASSPRWTVRMLWVLAGVTFLPNLFYYTNGVSQFGMRHALDFAPYLFVLMTLRAAAVPLAQWQRLLCVYSTAIGAYGIWYWNTFLRAGF